MTLPQHLSVDFDWATPLWIVRYCREALGDFIQLDPASSEAANIGIQAEHIICPPDDGLKAEWRALSVFINPPGGVGEFKGWQTRSSQVAWWRKSVREWQSGRAQRLIFLSFSIELMQAAQTHGFLGPLDHRFSLCIPRKRIAFDQVQPDGERLPGKAPSHANLIVGMGIEPSWWEQKMVAVGQVIGARS